MRAPARTDYGLRLTSNDRLDKLRVVRWIVLEISILNDHQIILGRVGVEYGIESRRHRCPLASIHIMAVQRNLATFFPKLTNE